jgi:methionyl-tRNA formyltransferase
MISSPLRILFAGSGEFGLPTLQALLDADHRLMQIYSQPDRPAGRGRTLTPTPIAQFALDHSLPLVRTENLNAEPLPPADLLVVIAFGQKISDTVAHHARLGSVNLHASRLPKYRGAAPIHWAILRGETVTGNSVIRLAQRMDAGAILAQSSIPVGDIETTGEIHDRLAKDGAQLMLHVIAELAEGRVTETPQDDSLATSAPKLSRETSKIDWTQPADVVARKIRGLSPWPGCRVRLLESHGQEIARLTLLRARVTQPRAESPGDIGYEGQVGAGNYTAIEVLEVQPEGKRPMTLADFKNGRDWSLGMRLESIL